MLNRRLARSLSCLLINTKVAAIFDRFFFSQKRSLHQFSLSTQPSVEHLREILGDFSVKFNFHHMYKRTCAVFLAAADCHPKIVIDWFDSVHLWEDKLLLVLTPRNTS